MNDLINKESHEIIDNLGDLNARFSGKTVLITGAAGFLGYGFLHYFSVLNQSGQLDSPCKIIAIDNFIRGVPEWYAEIEKNESIFTIEHNITNKLKIDQADFIIHGASIASPIFYRKKPLETMDANVMGLRNILDWSLDHDIESILFFSSSEIYGDPMPNQIPTSEDYWGHVSCTGPRACYDESKRYGETLCAVFHREFRTPVKVVRPFNNYGIGLPLGDRRIIPDLFSNILNDEDVVLLSDGLATRTFCYQSDAITGYLLALLSLHDGEAFNIGNDKPEISMRDLAKLMVEVSKKDLQVIYKESDDREYLTDNPQRRCPNIDKARQLINYAPKVELKDGLERVYNYYKQTLSS